MIKYSMFNGKSLISMDIEGVPYADMRCLLQRIIPGAWKDYSQVLNSSDQLIEDLGIKQINDVPLIPVRNVGTWLFTFSIKNMSDNLSKVFCSYRRSAENSYRVVWGMDISDDNLCINTMDRFCEYTPGDRYMSVYNIAEIFSSYGLPDESLQGHLPEGENYTPLEYIQFIASSKYCGPRGHELARIIEYIENLPNGVDICNYINISLENEIPPMVEYFDEYMDGLNALISYTATKFVGDNNVK